MFLIFLFIDDYLPLGCVEEDAGEEKKRKKGDHLRLIVSRAYFLQRISDHSFYWTDYFVLSPKIEGIILEQMRRYMKFLEEQLAWVWMR